MIYEIVQQNFVAVTIVSFLILFILTNNNFDQKTNGLFLASAICVLILIIEEAWEGQIAQMEIYSGMRVLLSAIGYTLRPMTAYFLVMISSRGSRRRKILISIPIVLNMLVSFSALFCKWTFWYTQANEFVRGPLGFMPFLTAGFYVLDLLVITIRHCKKGDNMEMMTVSAIVMLTVITTMMESVFDFRWIQCACCGISITFYYLFLHTNQHNRDVLTGALTRRRFYLDAEKYSTSLTAVISMDVNDLKMLNDKYGHLEGDKALIMVTEVVKKCIAKKASLYRTGGDEFMMLCYRLTEKEVQDLIEKICSAMEQTRYRCAIGYTLYGDKMDMEHVCQMADAAMYKNKVEMKGNSAEF